MVGMVPVTQALKGRKGGLQGLQRPPYPRVQTLILAPQLPWVSIFLQPQSSTLPQCYSLALSPGLLQFVAVLGLRITNQ